MSISLSATHRWLQRTPAPLLAVVALVGVALVGTADHATGAELSSSVFYVVPVAVAAWYGSRGMGLFLSFVASATWFGADVASGHAHTAAWIPIWNAGVRFAFFLIIADLLLRLRTALEVQRSLAEQDTLTGLANSRRFMAAVDAEVARSIRYKHPLTLAYIDLDGFKGVNDRLGHAAGDQVLAATGNALVTHVRSTDLAARLGGDEFAVLFPETNGSQAEEVLGKIRSVLEAAVAPIRAPVGFSIGVYTSLGGVTTGNELIRLADELMYEVKRSGKGHTTFQEEGRLASAHHASPESGPANALQEGDASRR